MVHIERWKAILIILTCVLGIVYSAPNVIPTDTLGSLQKSLPSWMPTKTVNLGLDLRGGAHLLYEVDVEAVFKESEETIVQDLRSSLRDEKIKYSRLGRMEKGARVTLEDAMDAQKVQGLIRKSDPDLVVSISADNLTVEAVMSDAKIKAVVDNTISQSIEIIRRRVDEMGTTEPTIARQGENRILLQVPGADAETLKRLVGKTAKLSFHMVKDLSGSDRSVSAQVLPMMDEPGRRISVERRSLITGEMLETAAPSFDQSGQPVVTFRFDSQGAKRFCKVTTENVNKPFAIVLDDEIISAPNIREPICGGRGQISGGFSVQEANDLAILLRAGALPAPLTVVEERTVGPSLGADSIAAGETASLIGMLLVVAFMALAYGLFGMMANVALIVNVALIMGLLSLLQATLTLPGIAGIALTIGMAVDGNVLIFERIREEVAAGRSPISAVDTGYSRAMATIVDANLTTLIAAIILFSFGTGPVKGFAVTLGIGIVTSFFTAIMVTRLMVVAWLLKKKPAALPL